MFGSEMVGVLKGECECMEEKKVGVRKGEGGF